mmetsp:Transcript_130354/g.325180  ORF Transcript_130354/g.325180 Transcript_130354/m.325180 type:complete len:258 (-) Transcript_130354:385-1158(-)
MLLAGVVALQSPKLKTRALRPGGKILLCRLSEGSGTPTPSRSSGGTIVTSMATASTIQTATILSFFRSSLLRQVASPRGPEVEAATAMTAPGGGRALREAAAAARAEVASGIGRPRGAAASASAARSGKRTVGARHVARSGSGRSPAAGVPATARGCRQERRRLRRRSGRSRRRRKRSSRPGRLPYRRLRISSARLRSRGRKTSRRRSRRASERRRSRWPQSSARPRTSSRMRRPPGFARRSFAWTGQFPSGCSRRK